MLITHWMKSAALLLYLAGIILVLTKCTQGSAPSAKFPGQPDPPPAADRDRLEKRRKHEEQLAERRALHTRLEADLKALADFDIPGAIAELAREAGRYHRKLPDLQHLTEPERWERETPVKQALSHARQLLTEYHAIDHEAQKGRDGPTIYATPDAEALTKLLDAFKSEGQGAVAAFAAALPAFVGKVPEESMASAIDAIAHVVLPADAFDPCRDPTACPKPAPPQAPASHAPHKPPTLCAKADENPRDLTVYSQPDNTAEIVARLRPRQCGILPTGHKDAYNTLWGRSAWLQIVLDGKTGWVTEGVLASEPTGTRVNLPAEAPPLRSGALRYCADAARLRGETLALRLRPDPFSPKLRDLRPGTCSISGTGRTDHYEEPRRRALWLEVIHDDGTRGWVSSHYVRQSSS